MPIVAVELEWRRQLIRTLMQHRASESGQRSYWRCVFTQQLYRVYISVKTAPGLLRFDQRPISNCPSWSYCLVGYAWQPRNLPNQAILTLLRRLYVILPFAAVPRNKVVVTRLWCRKLLCLVTHVPGHKLLKLQFQQGNSKTWKKLANAPKVAMQSCPGFSHVRIPRTFSLINTEWTKTYKEIFLFRKVDISLEW